MWFSLIELNDVVLFSPSTIYEKLTDCDFDAAYWKFEFNAELLSDWFAWLSFSVGVLEWLVSIFSSFGVA